jgi:hypothetical protein
MGQVDPHSTGESPETSLQRVDIGPTRREWCSLRQLSGVQRWEIQTRKLRRLAIQRRRQPGLGR